MKKNLKLMAITAMAAVFGMSSCSNDNDNVDGIIDNGETTSVNIMLSEALTRAKTAPIDEVAVNFKSGYVIFTNSLSTINKVTIISETEPTEAEKATGAKVSIDDVKRENMGGEIKNVPASATTVYIVGNLPAGVDIPVVSENISAVQDRVISVASQSNVAGSVADVTLYGDGVLLTDHPDESITDAKYAKIDVKPIAARVEIGQISYENSTNLLTDFRIDGIFINYYYPSMSLASEASTAHVNNTPANNAAADAMYTTATGGAYNSEATSVLCDFDATSGLGYNVSSAIGKSAANPGDTDDKNVWAYNVLAPLTADGTTVTSLVAPHLIIRLSNIKTNRDAADDPMHKTTQYLTIKEFREAGTPNVITSFAPGYIYYINNLTFNESNLTDIPEEGTITVYVEAKLMTWSRQEVEWGF